MSPLEFKISRKKVYLKKCFIIQVVLKKLSGIFSLKNILIIPKIILAGMDKGGGAELFQCL